MNNCIIDKYEGFIFDLDGTIYLEDKIIPNADRVIKKLVEDGKKVIFVSNKTTGSRSDYKDFLNKNDISAKKNDIITSTQTTINYLVRYNRNDKFYAIGEKKFIDELKRTGLKYSEKPNEIDIVLITLDRTLNYLKLEIAAKALDNGARFFAANIDNTCPVDGGEILDAGSTISALELRTDRRLEKNFGKPSKYIVQEILSRLDLSPDKCLIIGDRLETDIAMGNQFNIDTILVSTGVHKNRSNNFHPTYRISSVADLI